MGSAAGAKKAREARARQHAEQLLRQRRTDRPDIDTFVTDRRFLGHSIGEKISLPQRVLLKGCYGMPLTEAELAVWAAATQRLYPGIEFQEVTVVAGSRAGKDSRFLAVVVLYEAIYGAFTVNVGESAVIPLVAQDAKAAQIAWRLMRDIVEAFARHGVSYQHPYLKRRGDGQTDEVYVTKSLAYMEAAVLFRTEAISILDDPATARELRNLEQSGNKVDHPVGGHDDRANALCLSAVMAYEQRKRAGSGGFGPPSILVRDYTQPVPSGRIVDGHGTRYIGNDMFVSKSGEVNRADGTRGPSILSNSPPKSNAPR